MANVSRTVDIIFNGRDNVSGYAGKVTQALHKVETVVNDIADPVARAVDRLTQMETAILAIGAAAGTISLIAFKNYEYALIDLEKVLDSNETLAEGHQKAIEDLAIQYGKSAVEMVQSTTDFKRAGFSLEDSITLLNRALELSSAGMVDVGEATNDIIAIMKGMELGVEDATHVVDVINKVSDKYATNATELSDALRRVAPAAKLAGLSLEEVTAYLVPAIEVFRSGEEAGTAWRRGLIKLTDDAAPVIDALNRLRVQQRDTNGQLRNGGDILKDLIVSMQGATSANQLFAASQIFGNRQASKIIATLRDLDYVMEIEAVAAGATHEYTMEQVEKRWASLETQLQASKTAITLVATELGSNLKPATAKVLSAVTELFSAFRDDLREGAFDTLFSILDKFGDDLAYYLTAVGDKLPQALKEVDYSPLLRSFKDLFDKVAEIIDRFQLDEPEGLKRFLQDVIDTSASVVDITTGMIDTLDDFATKVVHVINTFNALGSEEKKSLGRVSASLKLISTFGARGALILSEMERTSLNVADASERVAGGIQAIAGAARLIATILIEPFTLLYTILGATTKVLQYDLAGAWEELSSHGNRVIDGLVVGTKNVYHGLDRMDQGTQHLTSSISTLGDESTKQTAIIVRGFDDSLTATEEFGTGFMREFTKLTPGVRTIMSNVGDVIAEEFAAQQSAIDKALDQTISDVAAEIERKSRQRSIDLQFKADIELDREAKDFIDRMTATGAYTGQKIGVFTDEDLHYLETRLGGIRRELAITTDAVEDSTKTELNVPDDTKFKAAQAKLLKEIDTNADIMEAKIKGFSDIAKSESDSISSSFESIGDSITNTGDVLTELYRQMSTADTNIFAQQSIQRKISEEESRRKEAFDLQKELTLAQIDLIKQRSAAMASGDPMITVSGDGLQPHLEAFMWEIFSAIQVRVSEDYGNFLLGIGAA